MANWYKNTSGYEVPELQTNDVQEVAFTSAWLSHAQFSPKTGRTNVTFKDGYTWVGTMTPDQFNDLATASSPGGWWHRVMMTTAAGSSKVGTRRHG